MPEAKVAKISEIIFRVLQCRRAPYGTRSRLFLQTTARASSFRETNSRYFGVSALRVARHERSAYFSFKNFLPLAREMEVIRIGTFPVSTNDNSVAEKFQDGNSPV